MTLDWWTLGLQAVNVIILIWLLQHFFWRPVAAIISRRKKESETLISDLNAKSNALEATRVEMEKTRSGFAAERQAILDAAKAEAEKSTQASLKAAQAEIEAMKADARLESARKCGECEKAGEQQALELAVKIATRLAGRLQSSEIQAAFLNWLLAEITAMPPDVKLALSGKDVVLDIACPAKLSAAEQASIKTKVTAALGAKPGINFLVEPDLIAGLELRGPHFTLKNSWQADLAAIAGELNNDQ